MKNAIHDGWRMMSICCANAHGFAVRNKIESNLRPVYLLPRKHRAIIATYNSPGESQHDHNTSLIICTKDTVTRRRNQRFAPRVSKMGNIVRIQRHIFHWKSQNLATIATLPHYRLHLCSRSKVSSHINMRHKANRLSRPFSLNRRYKHICFVFNIVYSSNFIPKNRFNPPQHLYLTRRRRPLPASTCVSLTLNPCQVHERFLYKQSIIIDISFNTFFQIRRIRERPCAIHRQCHTTVRKKPCRTRSHWLPLSQRIDLHINSASIVPF